MPMWGSPVYYLWDPVLGYRGVLAQSHYWPGHARCKVARDAAEVCSPGLIVFCGRWLSDPPGGLEIHQIYHFDINSYSSGQMRRAKSHFGHLFYWKSDKVSF